MKRVVAVLLVLVMVCSCALAAEITFMDFPWGIDAEQAGKKLKKVGDYYNCNEDSWVAYWEEYNANATMADGAYTYYPAGYALYASFSGASFPEYFEPYLVGGHSVNDIWMWCRYGYDGEKVLTEIEDSCLYMAEYNFLVMDTMSAYEDLKNKLNSLYGVGEETIKEDTGSVWNESGQHDFTYVEKSTTWYGDNNTSVRLEGGASSRPIEEDYLYHYLSLIYGKTDQDETIKKIEQEIKASELQSELNSYTSDLSGL